MRVERDYEAGELGSMAYDRQLTKQTEAIAAAEAERERLSSHADAIAASRVLQHQRRVGEADRDDVT